MSREVMQKALDALERGAWDTVDGRNAAEALREELAKPEEKAVRDLEEAEQYIQSSIDCAPEPLKRLGEWLTNVLDENQWPHAERLLLGAIVAKPAAGADELTDKQVVSACFSYRHDYGLLDDKAKGHLEFQCREWWRALRKEFECPSKHPMVLAAAPQPPAVDVEAVRDWKEGTPPHPYDKEWFIALLDNEDKVVLTALPEEYSYDYKTADETYYKKHRVKKWMQFPDSEFRAIGDKTND